MAMEARKVVSGGWAGVTDGAVHRSELEIT